MSSFSPVAVPEAADHERKTQFIRPPSYSVIRTLRTAGDIFGYLDLFLTICLHRINVRYKQSLLGVTWALLQPLSLMMVYFVIFSLVAPMPSEGIPYPVFILAGIMPWTYFSTSVIAATSSIVANIQIVTKVYFPREILPLSYVVVGVFDFVIAIPILVALTVYYRIPVGATILWAIPILLVETTFIVALSLSFSAIQVRFRDLGFAMPLIMQLWLFASPVVYPLSKVPIRFRSFYELNPMVGVLENFRRVVLQKSAPDFHLLGISSLISFLLLIASYAYFRLKEATMADVI